MPIRWRAGEPYLDPAALSARITWLEPQTVSGVSGSKVTYAPSDPPDRTWAEISAVRGRDAMSAGQDVSQVYLKVTIRPRLNDHLENRRFQDARGRMYRVQAVEDIVPGRLRFQVLTCLLIAQ